MNRPAIVNAPRIAVIGGYQPRRCGIATFTTDLVTALAAAAPTTDWPVIAMTDTPDGYPYPSAVWLALEQQHLPSYRRAAAEINAAGVELVLLQHEYGIFGGPTGEHVLALLSHLRPPLVTTLHTILREPDAVQRRVLGELARLSARLVVMSRQGAESACTRSTGCRWRRSRSSPTASPMCRSSIRRGINGGSDWAVVR